MERNVVLGVGVGLGIGVGLGMFLSRRNSNTTTTAFSPSESLTSSVRQHAVPMPNEELFREHTDRTRLFFGEEDFQKIRNKFVVVMGVGGVGSACAHVLLRTGVGRLRLVDPDMVTLSSLNRNAVAVRSDVGKPKVECLKEHFALICPETKVEAIEAFFDKTLAPALLAGNPDYVLDCIDNKETKVELLAYCVQNNIKVISSFGTGGATDPTKIRITDIADSYGCPFGREIRKELSTLDINSGITCVYSIEKGKKKLLPLPPDELQRVVEQKLDRKIRVRTIPVMMCIPTIVGTTVANVLLNDITGYKSAPNEEISFDTKTYSWKKIMKDFVNREQLLHNTQPSLSKRLITPQKLKTLVMDIWQGKSSLSNKENTHHPQVLRWRRSRPLAFNNLICLTAEEAQIHEKVEDLEKSYTKEHIEKIDKALSAQETS